MSIRTSTLGCYAFVFTQEELKRKQAMLRTIKPEPGVDIFLLPQTLMLLLCLLESLPYQAALMARVKVPRPLAAAQEEEADTSELGSVLARRRQQGGPA